MKPNIGQSTNATQLYPTLHLKKCRSFCWTLSCHVSLSTLNMTFAKTWTLFSDNVNAIIRKYSSRAFICDVASLDLVDSSGFRSFLGWVKFAFGNEKSKGDMWSCLLITTPKHSISYLGVERSPHMKLPLDNVKDSCQPMPRLLQLRRHNTSHWSSLIRADLQSR